MDLEDCLLMLVIASASDQGGFALGARAVDDMLARLDERDRQIDALTSLAATLPTLTLRSPVRDDLMAHLRNRLGLPAGEAAAA